MSKRFKVFLDSGANIHSKYETTTSLEELGIYEVDWNGMSQAQRENIMRDVAFEQAEWGYEEIEDGEGGEK